MSGAPDTRPKPRRERGTPSLRERFNAMRNLPPFLRQIWQTSPGLTLASLGLRLVRALIPVVTLYIGKLIIDEAIVLVGLDLPFGGLVQALREIPVEDQVVLELMYFEGLSGSELAGVLGLPEGTIRGRLARGKQRLRERVALLLAQAPTQSAQLAAVTPELLDVWALELRRQQGWA